jgi:hypothetical protein
MMRFYPAAWRILLSHASRRISFWAVLMLVPAAAAIHFSGFMPEAAFAFMAFAFPAALCLGWSGGSARRSLAASLSLTRAGSGSLLAAELALSTAGGALLSLLPLSALPGELPWQLWAIAPLESLAVSSLILWLEPWRLEASGLAAFVLAGLSLAPGKSWLLMVLSVPGFTFEAFRFAQGSPVHPDAFLALGLLYSAGTVVLATRRMRGLGSA